MSLIHTRVSQKNSENPKKQLGGVRRQSKTGSLIIPQLAWGKEPIVDLERMAREVEEVQESAGSQILSKEGVSKRGELLTVSNATDKGCEVSTKFSNRVMTLARMVLVEL